MRAGEEQKGKNRGIRGDGCYRITERSACMMSISSSMQKEDIYENGMHKKPADGVLFHL